jgi:hypothetical protein
VSATTYEHRLCSMADSTSASIGELLARAIEDPIGSMRSAPCPSTPTVPRMPATCLCCWRRPRDGLSVCWTARGGDMSEADCAQLVAAVLDGEGGLAS